MVPLLFSSAASAALTQRNGAIERHRHDVAPILKRQVLDGGLGADAGIVDEDVDAAEARERLVHHAAHIGFAR